MNTLKGAERFRFDRQISDTLQGRAYLATDLLTNKDCVIKEAWRMLVDHNLNREGGQSSENFLQEREIVMDFAKLDIPDSLIKGIDSWHDEKCYFYAMEHSNVELYAFIKHVHEETGYKKFVAEESCNIHQEPMNKPNEWIKNVSKIFKQLCQGIQWMHTKGYCHLDLSLENVMVDINTLNVKIIDFGLTQRFLDNNFAFKRHAGKIQYMSPEVYLGQKYDARLADVYSLGVILFMMLIGRPPYSSHTNKAFKYVINGRIDDILVANKRLRIITVDSLDLLQKIFRYEHKRITLRQILKHPFIANTNNQKFNEE